MVLEKSKPDISRLSPLRSVAIMGNSESKPEHSQHGVGESKDTGSIDRTTPTSPHAIPDKDSTTNSTGDVSDISGSQKMFVTSISPHDAIIYPPTTNPDKEKTLGKKEFEEKEFIDRINPTQNQDILMTVSDEVAPPGEIFCGGILTPSPKRRPETDLFPSIVNDIAAIPVNASLQLFHMVTFDLFVPNIFELASEGDAASLSAEFDARPNRVHEKGPEPFWTALFFACQDGKADTAKVCLERGAEIELIDQLGNTALVYCCYRGDISTFNLFMEYKANVNTKNIVGHTPLIIAATAGQPEILALLLDNGADIDFCDSKNETALIHAIREAIVDLAPQSEAAKVLIHRGADYSLISSDGWQAMHWASYRGLPSIIKTFLSKGVAVDLETQDETTPFMLACKNGKIEVAKLLQSLHADIRHKNVDGKSALTLACCSGKMDMIKWLKSEGLDIFDVTYDGRNNFMWACAHGQIEIARYLRDLGVEIDGDDDDGKNSFHLAMEGDHRPAGKYLLGLGFDVNAPYKAGNALTMAAMKGNFKNAIFLLENKADVNYLFKGKYSPLFYACAEKQWPLVKLLIDYGGDVHYTTPVCHISRIPRISYHSPYHSYILLVLFSSFC